jgi:hypothetical protein
MFSDTTIWPSASLVAKELVAAKSPRGQHCIENSIKSSIRRHSLKITGSVSLLPSPISGADFSLALRSNEAIQTSQNSSAVTRSIADFILFGWGQAEVWLTVSANAAPSASLERRLSAILLERARVAIG